MTPEEIDAIEARALAVPPIGHLVTELRGGLPDGNGEDAAYNIAQVCDTDVPALIAEVRRLQAENEDWAERYYHDTESA